MRTRMLLTVLCLCCVGRSAGAEELKPGLVYVFFNESTFQRPAASGVDAQIDMETHEHKNYARMWIGQVQFPNSGEVRFLAQADDGLRLFLDGKLILDGWAPNGTREATVSVTAGQRLPVRLDYFQRGGDSFMRLYWQWEGQPQTLVPPSAFWHGPKDLGLAKAIMEGTESVAPGALLPVIQVPAGDEEFKSSIYGVSKQPARVKEPIRLGAGPHLLIDDFLIERSNGLARRVNCPRRDPKIPNPIITGKEDLNFQPFLTVLRDPENGRFRMWYVARKVESGPGSSRLAYMESEDGILWVRPPRILEDLKPQTLIYSVVDEGRDFADPTTRYKLNMWNPGGLQFAASADGLSWRPWTPAVGLRPNHDITHIFRDTLRDRYVATISAYTTGPAWDGLRRTTLHSVSKDFLHWEKPWYVVSADDHVDKGQTQFYALNGYLIRGDLWIGLVKILRDDLQAPGTPKGAFGVGYTTLAWSRDGEHWVRDLEPFFEPDPEVGAWDHAHAWMDQQLPVGDEVYIYYGGYKNGHKMNRYEERQIGLIRIQRDRYVSRDAGPETGTILTPPVILAGGKMTVNADVAGQLQVRLTDLAGKPLAGFDAGDCKPIEGDSLEHAVEWKAPLATLGDKPLRIEFILRDARMYGFELAE